MVDWQSTAELIHDADAFGKFMHALLGLYLWEWFTSLDFDIAFIIGKRKFRWPLAFYFLGRYSLLAALVGIVVALNVRTEVDCQALYTFNQIAGNFTIGFASINLSLRTMAIWSQNKLIVIPIAAIICGHWGLLLRGVVLVKAQWVEGQGCAITGSSNTILIATYVYTMSFDFVVTILTAYKLAFKKGARSQLVSMIFADGLIYFVIAFLANTIAVIFLVLNLNAVMSVIAAVPSAVVSTIVSCRVVRRLSNYTNKGPEMFTPTQGSTLEFHSGQRSANIAVNRSQGVHVQMETFAVADKAAHVVKDADSDVEAQGIHDDFKRPAY